MQVTTKLIENQIALVTLEGAIDAYTAPNLDQALSDLLALGQSRFVLDFSGVDYISSAGLRSLLVAQKEARRRGGEVKLFGLNSHVDKIFNLAGFDQVFSIVQTQQEAIPNW